MGAREFSLVFALVDGWECRSPETMRLTDSLTGFQFQTNSVHELDVTTSPIYLIAASASLIQVGVLPSPILPAFASAVRNGEAQHIDPTVSASQSPPRPVSAVVRNMFGYSHTNVHDVPYLQTIDAWSRS